MKVEELRYGKSEIYDYAVHKTYPSADKVHKHGLRKRSKFFTADRGRLYYIGRKGSEKPCLVVESAEERRIIGNIHDLAHQGRDKRPYVTLELFCTRHMPETW